MPCAGCGKWDWRIVGDEMLCCVCIPDDPERTQQPEPNLSQEYLDYLKSATWKEKRSEALARSGGFCERCGAQAEKLEVHHLTYDRFGKELLSDLLVCCVPCHDGADVERKMHHAAKVWDRRVDGWATKRYGENWDAIVSTEDAHDELHDWLRDR